MYTYWDIYIYMLLFTPVHESIVIQTFVFPKPVPKINICLRGIPGNSFGARIGSRNRTQCLQALPGN